MGAHGLRGACSIAGIWLIVAAAGCTGLKDNSGRELGMNPDMPGDDGGMHAPDGAIDMSGHAGQGGRGGPPSAGGGGTKGSSGAGGMAGSSDDAHAGSGGTDGQSTDMMDAGPDADAEVAAPTEAVFELDAKCSSEGELGCTAHDATQSLLCSGGHWAESGTCDDTQRCDTKLGATQGQCLPIVSECEDLEAFAEFCRGNLRMTCGVDRVSADGEACPSDEVCVLDGDVTTCEPDDDECAMGLDDCDDDPDACLNVLGSYVCDCPDGYDGLGQGPDGCTDIVECDIGNGGCDSNPVAVCHEVVGGPNTCECPAGYAGNGAGMNGCADVDECDDNNGGCGPGSCVNTPGSHYCTCPSGFAGSGTPACDDIDECLQQPSPCNPGACNNTAGTYTCTCPAGYSGSGTTGCEDIDECSAGATTACGSGATGCTNDGGSFSCTCGSGYTGTGTTSCNDVNECTPGAVAACGQGATGCSNSNGTYSCTCGSGYAGTGTTACADIDDCSTGPAAVCGAGATDCDNSGGSYSCTCGSGYNGTGTTACSDRDECASGATTACGPGASACANSGGGYSCSCAAGYSGSGTTSCSDIDECSSGAVAACGTGATGCSNSGGSFSCTCGGGYSGTGTKVCTDLDECSAGTVATCGTGAIGCNNSTGSYSCVCASGYSGTGTTACSETDECAAGPVAACGAGATNCSNSAGSFSCTCGSGYTGTGTSACGDVNECAPGPVSACGPGATACANSAGSFSCTCGSGYTGTGTTLCTDVNECAMGATAACGTGATRCVNSGGGYSCECGTGYSPDADGRHCHVRAWGPAIMIENNQAGLGASFEYPPSIVIDYSGNVTVAWSDEDGIRDNIWTNRYVPGGGWGTAGLIETDNQGRAVRPELAFDGNGDVMAIWEQADFSTFNMWANRYSNGVWGNAGMIESSPYSVAYKAIGSDKLGSFIAIWEQSDVSRYNMVACNYVSPVSGWGSPANIETSNAGSVGAPTIDFDGFGNGLALWHQFDGTRLNLMSNRYTNGAWGVATLVEHDDSGSASDPALAVNSLGQAITVYMQNDGTRYNIWSSYYGANGWSTPVIVETSNAGSAYHPSVAIEPSGDAVAVWYQNDGTRNNIWTNRYTVGSGWGTAATIETGSSDAVNPKVATDTDGNAVAVWQQIGSGSDSNIWTNRYTDGSGWGTASLIETIDFGTAEDPALAIDYNTNDVVAVWRQYNGSRYDIWTNRYQ